MIFFRFFSEFLKFVQAQIYFFCGLTFDFLKVFSKWVNFIKKVLIMNCCINLMSFEGIYLKFESGVFSQKFSQGFY